MNSHKHKVFLTPNERSLAVHCLVELRNRLISDGRYTDAVLSHPGR